jgi:DHA3 family macrolide efflux protein-like MFS transporter
MRKFFIIWTGQAFWLFGSALVQFALAWWLTKSTSSATVLATATLVTLLPQVVAGPFVGALVDRWDRKRIMITADLAVAAVTAGLVALFAAGVIRPWHVYVAALARGLGQTFHMPAMQAIDILTAAIAVPCLFAVAIPRPEPSAVEAPGAAPARRGVLADMAAGFRYVRAWPGLLLPILVVKHFGGGPLQLSWLEAAMGIGLIVGGLGLGAWGGFKRRMYTSLLGVSLAGAGIGAIGFVPAGLLGVAVALMPLGLAIAGPVSDLIGVRTWYLVAGAVTVAVAAGAVFVPSLMGIEDHAAERPPAR